MREAVEGLNWMAGKTFLHGTDGPDELQSEVLRRIEALSNEAGNLGFLSKIPSPEAALRELLKGRSEYHQPDVPVALAPYSLERISLPESLVGLPEATDLLPESARQYLQGRELMLREEPPEEQSPPYWDPVLKRNKKHYRQFIQNRLLSPTRAKLWCFPVLTAGTGRALQPTRTAPPSWRGMMIFLRSDWWRLLRKELWQPRLWGKWQFDEKIINLEAQKSRAKTLAESTRETCPLKKPACTSEIWMCEHGKIEEVKGMF